MHSAIFWDVEVDRPDASFVVSDEKGDKTLVFEALSDGFVEGVDSMPGKSPISFGDVTYSHCEEGPGSSQVVSIIVLLQIMKFRGYLSVNIPFGN